MMGRKIFYLAAALALPVAIFLFLKFFGKNEFAVEPLYQTSVPSAGCDYAYQVPYVVPDSIRAMLSPGAMLGVVVFQDGEKSSTADRLIKRLEALFPGDPVSYHKVGENVSTDGFTTLRECVFFLADNASVTIVDRDGRIRGQYEGASMEDVDRMIVEMKIMLRKF